MAIKTKLTVREIQLAIRNSWYCDVRNNLIIPNVSWGLLPYEADLLVVKPSGLCAEFEIKRSFEDFKKDFTKHHTHDCKIIAYFYYVIPEAIKDKVKAFIVEHFEDSAWYPAVIIYNEQGNLSRLVYDELGYLGCDRRKNYEKVTPEQRVTLGRLVSIRYWNTLEELIGTGSPKDLKIKRLKENENLSKRTIKKLAKLHGSEGWIKTSVMLPENDRTVLCMDYSNRIYLAYYYKNEWHDPKLNEPIHRWVVAWHDIPVFDDLSYLINRVANE